MSDRLKAEKTLTINRPAAELYQYWHNFSNLPRFTKHLKEVIVHDDKRSHWVTTGPLGASIEWDAEIIEDRENELIRWTSLEGSDISNSGSIQFKPANYMSQRGATPDRGTEVKVITEYDSPVGPVGDALAKLFGKSPKQQLGDDLSRFKMLMEAGEIATTEGQPKGHD
jgi:uncharacterized membrane protein